MKVVFLDRDGLINRFPGKGKYVTKLSDFHILPGVLEAIRRLCDAGYTIFIISNQAGVGRGVFALEQLVRINAYLVRQVRKAGGDIKRSFYCTHHPDAGCDCRKPGIGNIKKALKLINKPLSFAKQAYFVGDTQSDILTGKKAGCTTIFALSGREKRGDMKSWDIKPDYIAKNLTEAAALILNNEDPRHTRIRRSRP